MRQYKSGSKSASKNLSVWHSSFQAPRVSLLGAFFFLGAALLFARLFFLQVADHAKWTAFAQGQHVAEMPLSAIAARSLCKTGTIAIRSRSAGII
ncbi:MAG: hypothetical protein WDN67_04435 [Candidatus Moraniibacteriota bacterium]